MYSIHIRVHVIINCDDDVTKNEKKKKNDNNNYHGPLIFSPSPLCDHVVVDHYFHYGPPKTRVCSAPPKLIDFKSPKSHCACTRDARF